MHTMLVHGMHNMCIMVCLLQYAERLVRAVEITTSDVCILARVLILTLEYKLYAYNIMDTSY